jgi:predicted DNA-binding protein
MADEMRELKSHRRKNQGRMRTKILRESVDKYIGR